MKHLCQSAGVSLKLSGHKKHAVPSVLYFSSFSGGSFLSCALTASTDKKMIKYHGLARCPMHVRGSSADYKEWRSQQSFPARPYSLLSPNRFLITLCTGQIWASEACLGINLPWIVFFNVSHVWDHRHGGAWFRTCDTKKEVWGANLFNG